MKQKHLFLLIFFSILSAYFLLNQSGASTFFLSLSFIMIAVVLGTHGKGLTYAEKYLRLEMGKKHTVKSTLLWSAFALIGSVALSFFISAILYCFGMLDSDLVSRKIQTLPVPVLLLAFTLAPIAEEVLFRGYVFRKATDILSCLKFIPTGKFRKILPANVNCQIYNSKKNAWIAGAVCASLVFSALHFSYGSKAELIVAFSIGILFCAVTEKTDSIYPALIAHAAYNLLSITMAVFMWA